jgi:putative nucleotidyltransferase with HDIG domain
VSDPVRFLSAFAQTLSMMALYKEGHPARARATDQSYSALLALQASETQLQFTFLGDEVLFGTQVLRDLRRWEWSQRLGEAGVQRVEFLESVHREDYEVFLDEVHARLTLAAVDSAESRPARRTSIKFGAIGLHEEVLLEGPVAPLRTATLAVSLDEEADAIRWVHGEVQVGGELPLAEAEGVVRSLTVAMHSDSQMALPLLRLKDHDQYTTTHALNVSVLAMGLAEYLGLGGGEVRAYGIAGLLHDLGKVRIPREILNKPGKLTDAERDVMRQHPADGAHIILESGRNLELASAVAYEHHVMINGGGYPSFHYRRCCHHASELVHVCDVYDALRTHRPYRPAWESQRALEYIEERAGSEFEETAARAFVRMMREWDESVAAEPTPTVRYGDEPLDAAATGDDYRPITASAPAEE